MGSFGLIWRHSFVGPGLLDTIVGEECQTGNGIMSYYVCSGPDSLVREGSSGWRMRGAGGAVDEGGRATVLP